MAVVRRNAWTVVCAPLFVSVAFPVFASQPTSSEQAITVNGELFPQNRERAAAYVRQLGLVVGERPAARWEDPVCVKVVGLPAQLVGRVEAQVRSVAKDVGARLAASSCDANLVIAFTDNAPAVVREISGRQSLGDVGYEERKALETSAAPIRWWYSSEFRGESGASTADSVGSPSMLASVGTYGSFGNGFAGRGSMNDQRTASLVSASASRAIRHATVVVDVNQASGKKLSSVVDYVAMVALAEVRPGASPAGSILSLFQANDVQRMSRIDRALLKGLYTMEMRRKADQHRRVLVDLLTNSRL